MRVMLRSLKRAAVTQTCPETPRQGQKKPSSGNRTFNSRQKVLQADTRKNTKTCTGTVPSISFIMFSFGQTHSIFLQPGVKVHLNSGPLQNKGFCSVAGELWCVSLQCECRWTFTDQREEERL